MKNSFLYNAYRSVTKRFGILLILLMLCFGIVITISSRIYLDHFETISREYYASKFHELNEDALIRVMHWQTMNGLYRLYESGDHQAIDSFFERHFGSFSATDARLLVTKLGYDPYSYKDRIMPAKVIAMAKTIPVDSPHPKYQWIGNKLWLIQQSNLDGYQVILAAPITGNQLSFLKDWAYGEYIESVSVTNEEEYVDRHFWDWDYHRMSYLIDENAPAYLTVEYDLDTLGQYFYIGYAIVLAICLGLFWILIRYVLRTSFKSAIQQLSVFETQVHQIAAGDYSKRIKHSGYEEFVPLEEEINQMSTAIESRNEQLKQNVRELYDLLVEVLEQKDPYTRGHSERVASYSLQIARNLGLADLDQIYSAALLHDIGKIAIPESVLRKTGALSKEEYDDIKTHPQRGFNLLLKSSQFEGILDGVLYHHERLDGSGYPCGLKGDEIPMQARIIAVADVYDALPSDRSYRPAMTLQEALALIEAGSGRNFDAAVVDCLLKCIKLAS